MRDIIQDLAAWWRQEGTAALATVVGVDRSAPRQPGASMALSADGQVVGSVSGGCVEGAVVGVGEQVIADGRPRLQRFGFSDEQAFSVGLTCGGQIDVFVEAFDRRRQPWFDDVTDAIAEGRPVAVATVIAVPGDDTEVRIGSKMVVWPDRHDGGLGTEGLDHAVAADARGWLQAGHNGSRRYGAHGERRVDDVTVFVESFAPRPRMIVFGAIDFAAAVCRIGRFLGYHVTVCDARPVFATPARFPEADEVVVSWPHRYLRGTAVDHRTVICVLTHDPKFDVPLLEVALRTDAAYVGAMGSRRTHDDRLADLRERGLSESQLARLRSPIGLDLGGRTPEETAVSVAAEIIALQWGGSGRPLSETAGDIHSPDERHALA